MKPTWGIGIIIAILLSFALLLLGVIATLSLALALIFLISGLWTIISGFMIAEVKDRTYYGAWGVFLACLSLFAVVKLTYAIGVTLLAIVGIIVVVLFSGRRQQVVTAASHPQQPAAGTPAASAQTTSS